jgi:hypothetical protein
MAPEEIGVPISCDAAIAAVTKIPLFSYQMNSIHGNFIFSLPKSAKL